VNPDIRAADNDRQQVIDALHRHTTDGRLSLDEFTERLDATYRARTYRELAAVTADLPVRATRRGSHRPALSAFAITAALLVVLLGVAVLAATMGWGHMNAMMTSMTTAMSSGCR
jgi:hypothetical protein